MRLGSKKGVALARAAEDSADSVGADSKDDDPNRPERQKE